MKSKYKWIFAAVLSAVLFLALFFSFSGIRFHDLTGFVLPDYSLDLFHKAIPADTLCFIKVRDASQSLKIVKNWEVIHALKDYPLFQSDSQETPEERAMRRVKRRLFLPLDTREMEQIFGESAIAFGFPDKALTFPRFVMLSDIDRKLRMKILLMKALQLRDRERVKVTDYRGENIFFMKDVFPLPVSFCLFRNILITGYGNCEIRIRQIIDILKEGEISTGQQQFFEMIKAGSIDMQSHFLFWCDMPSLIPYLKKPHAFYQPSFSSLLLSADRIWDSLNEVKCLGLQISIEQNQGRMQIVYRFDKEKIDPLIWQKKYQSVTGNTEIELGCLWRGRPALFLLLKDAVMKEWLKGITDILGKKELLSLRDQPLVPALPDIMNLSSLRMFLQSQMVKTASENMGRNALFFMDQPSGKDKAFSKGLALECSDMAQIRLLFQQEAEKSRSMVYYDLDKPQAREALEKAKQTKSRLIFLASYKKFLLMSNDPETLRDMITQLSCSDFHRDLFPVQEKEKEKMVSFFFCRPDLISRKIEKMLQELLYLDEELADSRQMEISNLLFILKISGTLDNYVLNVLKAFQSVEEVHFYEKMNNDFTLIRDFVIVMKKGNE